MPTTDELLSAADAEYIAAMQSIDYVREAAVQEQSARYKKLVDEFVSEVADHLKNPTVFHGGTAAAENLAAATENG